MRSGEGGWPMNAAAAPSIGKNNNKIWTRDGGSKKAEILVAIEIMVVGGLVSGQQQFSYLSLEGTEWSSDSSYLNSQVVGKIKV